MAMFHGENDSQAGCVTGPSNPQPLPDKCGIHTYQYAQTHLIVGSNALSLLPLSFSELQSENHDTSRVFGEYSLHFRGSGSSSWALLF